MKRLQGHDPVGEFRKLADGYLAETWEAFPEQASSVGLDGFSDRLGENSRRVREQHHARMRSVLQAMEALPDGVFRGDDFLDRRGMLAELRTGLFFGETFPVWKTNPQVHVQTAIESIFEPISRHPGDVRSALPSVESRLARVPEFLSAGFKCLRQPVPLWVGLACEACAGGVEFLNQIEGEFLAVSSRAGRLQADFESARVALKRYASRIRRLEPGRVDGYAIGVDAFEMLMRERTGLSLSLAEAEADGWELVRACEARCQEEAKRIGVKDPAAAIASAAKAWKPRGELIDEYRAVTESVKARLIERNLVTFPKGESLRVLPVPPFLRQQFPTAAYQQPPAYSKKQTGIFWVNDLSVLETEASKKRREIEQHFGVEMTAAHEAYPGHHLQFAIQNRHPSKLRRLFAHAIFYEGWTLWCERLCVDEGLVELPIARLVRAQDALWRAVRIVIDCGLHSRRLSLAAAARLLREKVGFTARRAQGDLNWYTSSPTVPMSYLLGLREVEKLHRHFVVGEGWALREFHDWMLSHGAIPWSWILEARLRGV